MTEKFVAQSKEAGNAAFLSAHKKEQTLHNSSDFGANVIANRGIGPRECRNCDSPSLLPPNSGLPELGIYICRSRINPTSMEKVRADEIRAG